MDDSGTIGFTERYAQVPCRHGSAPPSSGSWFECEVEWLPLLKEIPVEEW